MPELQEIALLAPDYDALIHSPNGQLRLQLLNPRKDSLGSICVNNGTKKAQITSFATRGARDELGNFPAFITMVSFGELVFLLIGRSTVFQMRHGTCLEKAFELFRADSADEGFFQPMQLITRGLHTFLKYESGIACFDECGQISWHVKCFYDDELVGIDDSGLLFRNEHANGGREWKIELSTGNKR